MGTHKDHHITSVMVRWRARAQAAEHALETSLLRATIELSDDEDGPATDVWVPNTPEHEDALRRLLMSGYGGIIEYTTINELLKRGEANDEA